MGGTVSDEHITPATRTAPERPRHGWWRRHAWALLAVAVLAPAVFVSMTLIEGSPLWTPAGPLVSAGDSVSLPGASMGPVKAGIVPSSDAAPRRTRVVSVRVAVTPRARGVACGALLLEETGGEKRSWQPTSPTMAAGHEHDTAKDGCRPDTAEPYRMTLYFLVPADANSPYRLSLQQFRGDDSNPVRFALDPAA